MLYVRYVVNKTGLLYPITRSYRCVAYAAVLMTSAMKPCQGAAVRSAGTSSLNARVGRRSRRPFVCRLNARVWFSAYAYAKQVRWRCEGSDFGSRSFLVRVASVSIPCSVVLRRIAVVFYSCGCSPMLHTTRLAPSM